jgi:hypothetical protein
LKAGGAGADRADPQVLHRPDDPADRGELRDVVGELRVVGVHGVGLIHREGDRALSEHVADRELPTECVASERRCHHVKLVWVGEDQDGYAGVLERSDRAVLVAEVRQDDDDAVEGAMVLPKELGVYLALGQRLNGAELGRALVEDLVGEAQRADLVRDFLPGRGHEMAGEHATVSEVQCKRRLSRVWLVHGDTTFRVPPLEAGG